MTPCVTHCLYHLPAGIQDDKAVDRAWKKESAEAGDGLGQVLYQLFKKRRSADLLVTKLQDLHESTIWGKVDVKWINSCPEQHSQQRESQLARE